MTSAHRWLPALAAMAALGAPPVSRADLPPPSITLSPSQFPGTLASGQRVGPLTLTNRTGLDYSVDVFPVALGQDRQGGIFVREDADARALAARFLVPDRRRFDFPAGASQSVLVRIAAEPRSHSLYEGVLFKATPKSVPRTQQIRNILQLNGSVLLDPPPGQARYALRAEGMRAEQAGVRRIRVLAAVANRGNVYVPTAGTLTVTDRAGKVALRQPLTTVKLLPGATVELPALITKPLAPGDYGLAARITAGPRTVGTRGTMRLFAVNQLRTQAAKLVAFVAPKAYRGQPVEIEATFRNTGNVAYAPRAVLEVRSLAHGRRPEAATLSRPMEVESAGPGGRGRVSTKVELPAGAPSYELRVRLLAGARELDAKAVDVTPTQRPGLLERIKDFLTRHALIVIGLLLLVLLAGAGFGLAYLRQARDLAGRR